MKSFRELLKELAADRSRPELATAAAIALGTSCYGTPIRFDNPPPGMPGHFSWSPVFQQYHYHGYRWLDPTLDAFSQTGYPASAASIKQYEYAYWAAASDLSGNSNLQLGGDGQGYLEDMDAATRIPNGLAWINRARVYYYHNYRAQYRLPRDTPTYIQVKFDLGAGPQYGWVGVTRPADTLEAFAWGYETTPGMPIAAGARPQCPLDGCERIDIADGDCRVGLDDLAALLAHYGSAGLNVLGDVNWDGIVDLGDLSAMLQAYGNICQ